MSGSALHMLYSSIAATDVMHRSRYESLLFEELRALGFGDAGTIVTGIGTGVKGIGTGLSANLGLGGDPFDLAYANMQVDLGDGSGPTDVRSPRCGNPTCPFKDE